MIPTASASNNTSSERLSGASTASPSRRSPRCRAPSLAPGVGIALAADLRIGCPRTLFATAFANVGLSGDYGSAWLLDRLVGPSRARELLFLGERVDAERSLSLGLVYSLVPADELASEALAVAGRLANGPRQALAGMKENLLQAPTRDLLTAMDAEVPIHMACGVSDDHREALTAFMGKRSPVYPAPWR